MANLWNSLQNVRTSKRCEAAPNRLCLWRERRRPAAATSTQSSSAVKFYSLMKKLGCLQVLRLLINSLNLKNKFKPSELIACKFWTYVKPVLLKWEAFRNLKKIIKKLNILCKIKIRGSAEKLNFGKGFRH